MSKKLLYINEYLKTLIKWWVTLEFQGARKATRKESIGVIFVQNRNILGLVQTPNFSWAEPYSN